MRKIGKGILIMAMASAASQSYATENGQQSYPLGVNTVLNAWMPEGGQSQFFSYTTFYSADRFAGANGSSAVPDFKSEVFVQTSRVLHTWNEKLGPFTMTSGIVVPLVHADINAAGMGKSMWGLGDIVVHPMILGYASADNMWMGTFAVDFSVPTGSYSANRLANTGLNSYSFMPNLNLTVFPSKKWELSATVGYEVNSPNRDTGYHSGNVAYFDWLVGYSVTQALQLGLQGYALRQTTDDTQGGSSVGDGYRGRVMAIGPQLRYSVGKTSALIVKWQHEFDARNRPEGDKLWFQFTLPL